MKMSKLSNQTNSQDPQAVNSRVFVGNLNTFQCSKTDVERMFQRYGRLAGISMHKGYAFVQFTNPFDARNACHGEDGRTVLSQTLGKWFSNPDTLICGNCRELFTDLTELLDHKRSYCKLRFTCKCLSTSPVQKTYPNPQAKLVCVACKDSFSNPWDLMVHAQAAHMVNIYELGESPSSGEDGKALAVGGDRTANSTPTMPCSPSAHEHGVKLNGNGAVNNPLANGIHELDDEKNDHGEVSEAIFVWEMHCKWGDRHESNNQYL
ncbi:AGAP006212-PA [Anopheles gambiae str. PEST]|uniref:AGAP006212-PA n=1 Tax=Anopheles gambiae TaxID=7165 RepID=A7UU55_ANOGA|nr:AGAP006212-PA [Anopheles gambiae str. PEST]